MGRTIIDYVRLGLTWFNWIQIAAVGGYTCYQELSDIDEPTRIVLAAYMLFFGLAGLPFEFGVPLMRRLFQFLDSLPGRGVFFAFIGTLGLSFGWSAIVPFISGAVSLGIGIFLLVCTCGASAWGIQDRGTIGSTRAADEGNYTPGAAPGPDEKTSLRV